jgi:propanediol utilization protein
MNKVKVMISNHHVHLHLEDLSILFGEGYELTVKRSLGGSEFAANETVLISGPNGTIENIRVLGPLRPYTQVELLRSDTYVLGINPPIAESVESCDATELTITGPKGQVTKKCGIIAWRHIHMPAQNGNKLGLKDHDIVSVKVEGERELEFNRVLVRFMDPKYDKYNLDPVMHVDVEEANAAYLTNGDMVNIVI